MSRSICVGRQAARVAAAVEPLVVVADEPAHRLGEAAELVEQPRAPFGVPLDHGVLVVVERARLLQDRVGDRELADVVHQAADREARAGGSRRGRAARRPARRAARRGACAARCSRPSAASRSVSARTCEPRKRSSAVHELGRVEVAGERPRLGGCAPGRARPGCRRARMPSSSSTWPSHQPSSRRSSSAPRRATSRARRCRRRRRDRATRRVSRNVRNARSASTREEDEADREQRERARAVRRRGPAAGARDEERRRRRGPITVDEQHPCEDEQRLDAAQDARQRERREREDRGADRERRAAGQRDHAVRARTRKPGVARPCSASSAAITANAVPTSTVRVSLKRAPTIVSATAAAAAASAVTPTA